MTPEWQGLLARHRPGMLILAGSAGALDALLQLLKRLPPDYGLAVVVMVHLPERRDSRLVDILQQQLALPVREAADKAPISAGTVYVAGSGYHLSVEHDRCFSLSQEAPVHFARPAIDLLMASAADVYGPALAAVLLTGANQDGAQGMQAVKAAGGLTLVQDPAEAQVATMPAQAIKLQMPDLILPLDQIGAFIVMLEKECG